MTDRTRDSVRSELLSEDDQPAAGGLPAFGGHAAAVPDRGLRTIISVLTAVAVVSTALEVLGLVVVAWPPLAVAAGVTAALALWLRLVARGSLRKGQIERAVGATCLALWVAAILIATFVEAARAVVAVPLVAVAIALPYVSAAALVRVMVASWLVVVWIAVVAEVVPYTDVPTQFLAPVRISGVAASGALVLVLLWEFSRRLRAALAQMSRTNAALISAEGRVEQTNAELRRRVSDLEQRSRELTQLGRLGDLLQSSETSEEVYAAIAQAAGPLFAGDPGALYEVTADRTMVTVAHWGDPTNSQPDIAPSACLSLRRGRAYVVEDTASEPVCPHLRAAAGVTSYLCVPLIAQSEAIGLLHVQLPRRGPRIKRPEQLADRQRLAVAVAEQLGLGLANLRLRATLREQSTRDELTGVYNRRYMEESLDRELHRSVRAREPLGLIMVDLDHFKRFNDEFGHAVGDMVLRLIGDYLQSSIRAEDIACRYGGEEFTIILPRASLVDTQRRAEQLRAGVAALHPEQEGPSLPQITLSIGVAAHPIHGATRDGLLAAADGALYRAKLEGRDRVVVAGTRERLPMPVGDPANARDTARNRVEGEPQSA
jgi:diguanylate cyclase (GGDEF)-like protein